jgi:S1-C subfamily serine protease
VRFKLLFGATFRNLTTTERESLQLDGGVQIGSVVGGTPASEANLMSGDYVVAVNGMPVADRRQFQEFLSNEAGKAVTLKVIRNRQRADRVVRLGAMPVAIKDP